MLFSLVISQHAPLDLEELDPLKLDHGRRSLKKKPARHLNNTCLSKRVRTQLVSSIGRGRAILLAWVAGGVGKAMLGDVSGSSNRGFISSLGPPMSFLGIDYSCIYQTAAQFANCQAK